MRKIILIFLLCSFLSLLSISFCFAQRKLEITYPSLPKVQTPMTTKTALPNYLRYVFTFAIAISGIVAFGAMIYGGLLYVTSTGDPAKISDAKDQVIASFLGLIIILSSFLILNTINPKIVIPVSPPLEPAIGGIYAYVKENCADDPDDSSDDRVLLSQAKIPDVSARLPADKNGNPQSLRCIEFRSPKEELTVWLYSEKNFGGTKSQPSGPGEKFNVTGQSMKLEYHLAGVYLYATDNCTGDKYGTDYVIYQASSATLQDFDDKTKSIKFLYGDKDPDTGQYRVRFAAILHEKENYIGEAKLFEQDQKVCKKLFQNSGGTPNDIGVSSITVYLKPVTPHTAGGVRFWEDKNYTGCALPSETGFYGGTVRESNLDTPEYKKCGDNCNSKSCNDQISSMEMDGHYIALLFRDADYKGDCEVFTESKPDFRSFRIGQCGWLGRNDCLSSFIIKARK